MRATTSTFGEAVREIREGLNVTTGQLAKAAGIHRTSIQAIECGRCVTDDEFHHLAAGAAWLLTHTPGELASAPAHVQRA